MKARNDLTILGIAHVAFQVADLKRSLAYYSELYGFEPVLTLEEERKTGYLKVNDDQFLAFVEKAEDIQVAYRGMLRNGLPDLERFVPMVGRTRRWLFNVHDLDGTRVEFMESAEV